MDDQVIDNVFFPDDIYDYGKGVINILKHLNSKKERLKYIKNRLKKLQLIIKKSNDKFGCNLFFEPYYQIITEYEDEVEFMYYYLDCCNVFREKN